MENPFAKDAPLIDPEELPRWVVREDDEVLVFNKPGWLVCHPSKNGPWSSLVGAVREYYELDKIHMISRIDRETSGLVVFAKHKEVARKLQIAFSDRRTEKTYHAILCGNLKRSVTVEGNMLDDKESPVVVQQRLSFGRHGKFSRSEFTPIEVKGDYTLAKVLPETGRKHQIRVHAKDLEMPILGDKIYGPDPNYYLEFIKEGWTKNLAENLIFPRQALHASGLRIYGDDWEYKFEAPLFEDIKNFWEGL